MIRSGRLPSTVVLSDARDFLPSAALLFSSEAQRWRGAVLHRFHLRRMREEAYAYASHMIAVPRSGRGRLHWRCEGRKGTARVRPGGISIQPGGRFPHWCEMEEVTCDTLHLDAGWLREVLEDDVRPEEADLRAAPETEDLLVVQCTDRLAACALWPNGHTMRVAAEETLARLGAHLLRSWGTHPVRARTHRGGLSAWRLRRVLHYLEAHGTEAVSLESMARAAGGLSVYYFAHLFRQSTGMSPHRYLREWRVLRARQMLEHRHREIAEVAQATGFCDHSHLTREFKRLLGLTPSEFQKRGKSKNVQAARLVPGL